ncbi:MAG: YqeG family HAD IIIA-type phosphatase [Lachnospiraceae bacterium]|nr:YqeG family HAD IIIA-type phosphatase [Lachnospiraceae bacterium]
MLKRFFPNTECNSTYKIDFEDYYKRGYRGVIFDIDNTLVPHDAPADDRAIALMKRLKEIGFKVCLLSNNKEPRVKSFNEPLDVFYIFKANKPVKSGYRKAMEIMGTDEKTTLSVGDQLFTDVWGANRVGIYTILVRPIHPKEEIQIVLKRILEKPIIASYRRRIKKGLIEADRK